MTAPLQKLAFVQRPRPQARGRSKVALRGGSPVETVERRERIARLAWPLFLKKDYDNVSIDEITEVMSGLPA